MLNKIEKWLGYVECFKCKTKFRKNKNTSVGMMGNLNKMKTVYYCNKCTNEIVKDLFKGKKPKVLKEFENGR